MGQPMVDLPDPLEKSPASAAAPTADELMAQMAGDEIDRLLAEADVQRDDDRPADEGASVLSGAATTPDPTIPSPGAPVSEGSFAPDVLPDEPPIATPEMVQALDEQTASQLDALFDELTGDGLPPEPASPPAAVAAPLADIPILKADEVVPADVAPAVDIAAQIAAAPPAVHDVNVDDETARQLDALFDTLVAEAASMPVIVPREAIEVPASAFDPTPVAATPAAVAPELDLAMDELFKELSVPVPEEVVLATKIQAAKAKEIDPAGQTSALEKQVLTADLEPAPVEQVAPEVDQEPDNQPPSTPFYLKPLLWLNAPLLGCSDAHRELLAKLGIVTLVNALAVLMYVVVFRRH